MERQLNIEIASVSPVEAPNAKDPLSLPQQAMVDRTSFEMTVIYGSQAQHVPLVDSDHGPQFSMPEADNAQNYTEPTEKPTVEAATPQPEREEPEDKFTNTDLANYVLTEVVPTLRPWHQAVGNLDAETLTSLFNGLDVARARFEHEFERPITDPELYRALEFEAKSPDNSSVAAKLERALEIMRDLMNGNTTRGRLPRKSDIPE